MSFLTETENRGIEPASATLAPLLGAHYGIPFEGTLFNALFVPNMERSRRPYIVAA